MTMIIHDCLACLQDHHDDCDTGAWDDLGQPVVCDCWLVGHPGLAWFEVVCPECGDDTVCQGEAYCSGCLDRLGHDGDRLEQQGHDRQAQQ